MPLTPLTSLSPALSGVTTTWLGAPWADVLAGLGTMLGVLIALVLSFREIRLARGARIRAQAERVSAWVEPSATAGGVTQAMLLNGSQDAILEVIVAVLPDATTDRKGAPPRYVRYPYIPPTVGPRPIPELAGAPLGGLTVMFFDARLADWIRSENGVLHQGERYRIRPLPRSEVRTLRSLYEATDDVQQRIEHVEKAGQAAKEEFAREWETQSREEQKELWSGRVRTTLAIRDLIADLERRLTTIILDTSLDAAHSEAVRLRIETRLLQRRFQPETAKALLPEVAGFLDSVE